MLAGASLITSAIGLKLPCFPCDASKKPCISKKDGGRGFLDASLITADIERMFGHRRAKLIGVPSGHLSGVDILDLDYRHGAASFETDNRHRMPETRIHETQSGGRHLLFIHAPGVRNSAGKIAPGVDVRGDGGYFVTPPSAGYSVISDAELCHWPDWLLEKVLQQPVVHEPIEASQPRQPVSSRRIEQIIRSVLDKVRGAADGSKHFTLRNQALVLGGIQHHGSFGDGEAIRWLVDALPSSVVDRRAAETTAAWGIENGKRRPIEIEDSRPVRLNAKSRPAALEKRGDDGMPLDIDDDGYFDGLGEDESVRQAELILSPGSPLDSARAFIDRNHMLGELRTAHHQSGTFYTWANGFYTETATEEMRATIYRFLDKACMLKDKKLVAFDPTRAKVLNVLEATAAHTQLPAKVRAPAWLDNAEHPPASEIVVCTNGLLHLPTRQLLDHTPAFFTVNALDFAYDPAAPAPVAWLAFLKALWPDDPASITALQEMFGLSLTGETRHQKAFLIVGPKRSGKGTIARILTLMLGQPNVCGPTLSSLGQNFGIAPLIGKRLAIISDARLGGKADQQVIVERILAITGEDSLTVDRKFKDGWTGRLETRFLVLSNELPRLGDASGAVASRFIIWVLRNSFFGKEDLALTDKLTKELPGILNWALVGWQALKVRGYFVTPPSAAGAQQELEDLGSPIGAFLRERCVVDASRCVECGPAFDAWIAWCRNNNRDHPGTVQMFGRDLRAAVPGLEMVQPRDEHGIRRRYYQGLDFA